MVVLIWPGDLMLIQKNDKTAILSLKFMSFIRIKSSGAIFGTFVCQFHISPALSE